MYNVYDFSRGRHSNGSTRYDFPFHYVPIIGIISTRMKYVNINICISFFFLELLNSLLRSSLIIGLRGINRQSGKTSNIYIRSEKKNNPCLHNAVYG